MWPLRWAQRRQHGAGDVDEAEHIGAELRLELLRRAFLKRAEQRIAGIVDQHVDPPEPLDRGLEARGRLAGLGEHRAPWRAGCQRNRAPLRRIGIAPGGDHLVACRQGRFGDFCADPARGAGNEPDLEFSSAMSRVPNISRRPQSSMRVQPPWCALGLFVFITRTKTRRTHAVPVVAHDLEYKYPLAAPNNVESNDFIIDLHPVDRDPLQCLPSARRRLANSRTRCSCLGSVAVADEHFWRIRAILPSQSFYRI